MAGLGKVAAAQLQKMKIDHAHILMSAKVNHELIGDFWASMNQANFEWSKKAHIGAEEDFKGDSDDPRKSKHTKVVSNWKLSHEELDQDVDQIESEDIRQKVVRSQAVQYAREIANERGSVADPDYMEKQILQLVAN